jgi:ABC-type cobalamin/Fe3+-siderophores transport system ATPase subunit
MLEVKDATIAVAERTLARRLSFIADDGKITCITGPEASGKTTFIRTLMGFLPVAEGFVTIDGELLTLQSAPAFRRMMGYLPQNIHLLRNQLYPPEAPKAEADEYTVWQAPLPQAETIADTEPLTAQEVFRLISQTVSAAASRPIIIADEPASHLTPQFVHPLIQLLQQQAREGKCVLIASRNPQLIAAAHHIIDLTQFQS